jgi:uncharacterized membrane protein YhaH (DUF805 family)
MPSLFVDRLFFCLIPRYMAGMSPSLKTFIGSILLVALMGTYAMVAVTVASARLSQSSGFVQLAFFAVTGLLWILPAMGLVSWMLRDRRKPKP